MQLPGELNPSFAGGCRAAGSACGRSRDPGRLIREQGSSLSQRELWECRARGRRAEP